MFQLSTGQPITRGVFQGDTISPIIFRMVLNPILKLTESLNYPRFTFRVLIQHQMTSHNHDPPSTCTYIEPNSNETTGWYRCQVADYSSKGVAQLLYPDGGSEMVDLSSINWYFVRKCYRNYSSLDFQPLHFIPSSQKRNRAPKFGKSTEHKVKVYADDPTVINIDQLDSCCLDLDLQIRADKCVTLSFKGQKIAYLPTVPHSRKRIALSRAKALLSRI